MRFLPPHLTIRVPTYFTLILAIMLPASTTLGGERSVWDHYGGDAGGSRYVKAVEINPGNVARLQEAWHFSTGDMARRPEIALNRSAFETTPILTGGLLVFCTPFNEIIALDPGTGAVRWRHDAEIDLTQRTANQFVCRGVTVWEDKEAAAGAECTARLFMGTNDGRLIAVDRETGEPCNGFGDAGRVAAGADRELLWSGEYQMTSPPVVWRDLVIVGSSIADNARVDAPSGRVRAYDARTGALRWSFDPVPRDGERAGWGEVTETGGANAWAPLSVDEARGLLFIPTSSPSVDFFGGTRVGDNPLANAVVALKADTGEVVWSFQTVHHDVWDYDVPAQPSLITVQTGDGPRDAVAQVTKTGFLFVLDRETGEPVFPVDEVPVPQGGVAGEQLSPTQPIPQKPPALVSQALGEDDMWGLAWFDRNACRDTLRNLRNEGLFTPPSLEGTVIHPFTGGGANWGGMAFDPERQIAVVNMSNAVHIVRLIPRADYDANAKSHGHGEGYAPQRGTPYGVQREVFLSPLGLPCNAPPWGVLTAVDLASGGILWSEPFGTTEELAPVPIPFNWGTPNIGGPLVTASGLIFIAATMDNNFRAFDTATGEKLWQVKLPAGGQATPMSYVWKGRQYVVIAAGGHSTAGTRLGDSVNAFALPE